MPCGCNSRRSASVSPRRPNFVALYTDVVGTPINPAIDATLMITPRPRRSITGATARVSKIGAMRLRATSAYIVRLERVNPVVPAHPGIVDQHVDLPVARDRGLDDPHRFVRVRQIRGNG